MTEPILYESHSHTPLCKHATGDPEEYAEQFLATATELGLPRYHRFLPARVLVDVGRFSGVSQLGEQQLDRSAINGLAGVHLDLEVRVLVLRMI